MKKLPRLAALLAVVAAATACMGSFALTRGLYRWNESLTGSKVVNNVIFWALNVIPVYSLAVTGDACIFNLIEFWTGTNLIANAGDPPMTGAAVVENADGSITVTRGAEQFLLVPRGEDRVDVVVDGAWVGSAQRTSSGGIVALDAAGNELAVVTPEEAELGASLIAR